MLIRTVALNFLADAETCRDMDKLVRRGLGDFACESPTIAAAAAEPRSLVQSLPASGTFLPGQKVDVTQFPAA